MRTGEIEVEEEQEDGTIDWLEKSQELNGISGLNDGVWVNL